MLTREALIDMLLMTISIWKFETTKYHKIKHHLLGSLSYVYLCPQRWETVQVAKWIQRSSVRQSTLKCEAGYQLLTTFLRHPLQIFVPKLWRFSCLWLKGLLLRIATGFSVSRSTVLVSIHTNKKQYNIIYKHKSPPSITSSFNLFLHFQYAECHRG